MAASVWLRVEIHREILRQIGGRAPETGGLLGMHEGIVTRFWFDAGGVSLPDAYLPDTAGCEAVLNGSWRADGVSLAGFVHSHRDSPCPSVPDRRYMQQICHAVNAKELLLCILHDGVLYGWRMRPSSDGSCSAEKVDIRLI